MAKKKSKLEAIDGFGPKERQLVHKVVRQAWSWSRPWRLAKKRALKPDGFYYCEDPKCFDRGKPVPKVFVDHIDPVGEVGGPDYIKRMFIPSSGLQCLCKRCHDAKTKQEKRIKKGIDYDFS